ncbi:MAG: ATP12 family protein [Alphaproteobacteria bacterium]
MKRFYKLVSVEKSDNGYHILLDGRAVKTKSKAHLSCLNKDIANEVMQEWAQQGAQIIPDSMPFTQIESTRIDRVSAERQAMSANVLKYLDTDLICYVAASPEELVEEQNKKWALWRTWFGDKFKCKLDTTTGLAALKQDARAHKAAAEYTEKLDDARFTILQIVTPLSGSLILGLSFIDGASNADDIFAASYVEEHFKDTLYDAQKYGRDPLLEKQQNAAIKDLTAAQKYLSFL